MRASIRLAQLPEIFAQSERSGTRLATGRIDAASPLRVVDAIVSGTHERGASHYELLRAFADDETLERMDEEFNRHRYRTHEFGDSVFVERAAARTAISAEGCRADLIRSAV